MILWQFKWFLFFWKNDASFCWTPLMYGVWSNKVALVRELCRLGGRSAVNDLDRHSNGTQWSPLALAVVRSSVDMVKALLESPGKWTREENSIPKSNVMKVFVPCEISLIGGIYFFWEKVESIFGLKAGYELTSLICRKLVFFFFRCRRYGADPLVRLSSADFPGIAFAKDALPWTGKDQFLGLQGFDKHAVATTLRAFCVRLHAWIHFGLESRLGSYLPVQSQMLKFVDPHTSLHSPFETSTSAALEVQSWGEFHCYTSQFVVDPVSCCKHSCPFWKQRIKDLFTVASDPQWTACHGRTFDQRPAGKTFFTYTIAFQC